MLPSKLNPPVIYREKLHKPNLSVNTDRLDKKSDLLLKNLCNIDTNINKFSEEILSIQNTLTSQNALINLVSNKHEISIENLNNLIEKHVERIDTHLQIIDKKLSDVLEKLSEFDVAVNEMTSMEDVMQQAEEIPKDWISEDDEENNEENNEESDGD